MLAKVPISFLECNPVGVFIIRNRQTVRGGALIYPIQGGINVHDVWYKLDTSKLNILHKEHPLKFHTETRKFGTYLSYVAYANGILNDSSLLFFFGPTLTYEGSFTITAKKTNSPDSEISVGVTLTNYFSTWLQGGTSNHPPFGMTVLISTIGIKSE